MKLTFHDAKTRVHGLDDRIQINSSGVIFFTDHAIMKAFPILETTAFSIATNTDDQSIPDTSIYLVRNNKNGDVPILNNSINRLYINIKAFLVSNRIHFPAKVGFEVLSHEGAKVIRLLTSLKGQLVAPGSHPEIPKYEEEDESPVVHHSTRKTHTTLKKKGTTVAESLKKGVIPVDGTENAKFVAERKKLLTLAKKHSGNCVKMGKEYGIADSTMLYKLRRYGIDINEFRNK